MRPLFVPFGASAPPQTLAVDGAIADAAAIYSHWQGDHRVPTALAADTSTGMVLRAATNHQRWLAPYAQVANNHLDGDGLLSVIAAVHPRLALRHAEVCIAAATAGDFVQWTGEPGFRLLARLHAWIHRFSHGNHGQAGWEQSCLDAAVADPEALLCGDDPAWLPTALTTIHDGIDALRQAPPTVLPGVAVISWQRRLGRPHDHFPWLDAGCPVTDLPLIALSTAVPADRFQLLLEHTAAGTIVQLDAPRHSWAVTVDLPTIRWPLCRALADELTRIDATVTWEIRPGAERHGFTCLLASTRDGYLAATTLDDATVTAVVQRHVRSGSVRTADSS